MTITENFEELKSGHLWISFLSEFFGTFLLVLFGCGSCYLGDPLSVALTFGLTVAMVVWLCGHVSGAHINPAVTIGFFAVRKFTLIRTVLYMCAQILGAIGGSAFLKSIFYNISPIGNTLCTSIPNPKLSTGSVFGVEFFITLLLVMVIFSTVDNNKTIFKCQNPFAIGLAVTAGALFSIKLTGGGLNPARVFGPAVISGIWDLHWVYWIAPLLAGIIGGWFYEFLLAGNSSIDKIKDYFKPEFYDKYFKEDKDEETSRLNNL